MVFVGAKLQPDEQSLVLTKLSHDRVKRFTQRLFIAWTKRQFVRTLASP